MTVAPAGAEVREMLRAAFPQRPLSAMMQRLSRQPASVFGWSTTATRLADRPWFKPVARIGICARGVIYLVLAYLALDIAVRGSSPSPTTGQGALQEIVRQPAGPALLVILAFGLVAYGLWRLMQALTGQPGLPQRQSVFKRVGWFAIAVIYFGLFGRAVELLTGGSSGNSASNNPQPFAARVLGWPGGVEILGAVGACLVIGGVALATWGFAHDYDEDLHLGRLSSPWRRTVKALGAIGDLTRGFLIALVGGYVLDAAVVDKAAKTRGVDQALRSLAHRAFGPVLVVLVAAGLLCFALYSFADARLRVL